MGHAVALTVTLENGNVLLDVASSDWTNNLFMVGDGSYIAKGRGGEAGMGTGNEIIFFACLLPCSLPVLHPKQKKRRAMGSLNSSPTSSSGLKDSKIGTVPVFKIDKN
jgi:hypothetical protein